MYKSIVYYDSTYIHTQTSSRPTLPHTQTYTHTHQVMIGMFSSSLLQREECTSSLNDLLVDYWMIDDIPPTDKGTPGEGREKGRKEGLRKGEREMEEKGTERKEEGKEGRRLEEGRLIDIRKRKE